MSLMARWSSRRLVAALGYQDVTDTPQESGFQQNGALAFKLSTARFSAHLDQIAAGPVRPVLVPEIDLTRPGRHLLLTFDDGGKSALLIGEELCRRGWRGHFFITTGLIGRRTFLTTGDIRQLRRCGHVIGSHSHNHPDIYRELRWEHMVVEWQQSADVLGQLLGEPCTTAAVPGHQISRQVLRSAAAVGLKYVFTSEPWPKPRTVGGTWVLGRFCPQATTTPQEIGELIRYRGWSNKLLVQRLESIASRRLHPLHRMYSGRSIREWLETSR